MSPTSRDIVTSFFPAQVEHVWLVYIPGIFNALFPPETHCPEPSLHFPLVGTIRRPVLASFALLGICLGWGGAALQLTLLGGKGIDRCTQWNFREARFYWFVTYLFFGCMNMTGLWLHCLLPFPTDTRDYTLERPLLWIGDTFTTGVFGSSLWAAAILEVLPANRLKPPAQHYWNLRQITVLTWSAANLLGIGAIAWYWWMDNETTWLVPRTLPLELWYLLPPSCVAPSALLLLLYHKFSFVLLLTLCFTLAALVMARFDLYFCEAYGNNAYDLLTGPTILFGVCDVLYFGLGVWLLKNSRKRVDEDDTSAKIKKV